MRGLAALYVVLGHVQGAFIFKTLEPLPVSVQRIWGFLGYCRYAVAVFIVLSGFCLMLPVVRAPDGRLQGGVFAYLKRRARRILPPYYAALLCSLAVIALSPLRHGGNGWWDEILPAFRPDGIVSHLLLLHNLRTDWIYTINCPFWSVATEWQIYFVFALCLLPLWRRFGVGAVLLFSFGLTWLPYMLWPHPSAFVSAGPWYLGLFSLGMAGAVLCASKSGPPAWSSRVPWLLLTGLLLGIVACIHRRWPFPNPWYADPILGVAVFCFIVHCHRSNTKTGGHDRFGITRLLESRPALALGAFSYSLYLTHWPVLALTHLFLKRQGLPVTAQFYLLLALGVPLCLGVAYGFHLLFERRSVSARPSARG